MPEPNRAVFVVHGRNTKARDAMFEFLRALDLHPIEWSEAVQATGQSAPYIGDILDAAFSRARAVVVLFTPDDEAQLRPEWHGDREPPHETSLSGQARPNVLFEAGLAMGRHVDRTVLVEVGKLRPFSDIAGRHVVRVDCSQGWRKDLATRLETAGCPVNLNGNDWRSAGNFSAAIAASESESTGGVIPRTTTRERAVEGVKTEPAASLSEPAGELLAAAVGAEGQIVYGEMRGLITVIVEGHDFHRGNARDAAKWRSAFEELKHRKLVERLDEETFLVTDKGFTLVAARRADPHPVGDTGGKP